MASSLTPAYIRIAGPSTSHMTFHNSTITFTDLTANLGIDLEREEEQIGLKRSRDIYGINRRTTLLNHESDEESRKTIKNKRQSSLKEKGLFGLKKGLFGLRKDKEIHQETKELAISHTQWQLFVQWAKKSGFDLVFALNNDEKTSGGLWDPNSALNILTLAEKSNFSDIYWQLGYECKNQSIDEYLNDLETLRAIIESFGPAREWRAVGGDVTPCLQADSKSDFRDFVTLTDELMDAVVLNGHSSAEELQRMSEKDRLKLLKRLSNSTTPLWLTDGPHAAHSELRRAAHWLSSLGYSARNGIAVHFRELPRDELYEPTLSFYMALLFKNLVGERVLNVEMEASDAAMFAHCTSLRHKPVPGAVTLYAANLDDEAARFAVKLSRKEEGGDIMQFILGHDLSGNIIINGRSMHEGDIRPVVKRVRPYKTLLLNLPPRSFGFWVIANTRIEACQETDDEDITNKEFVEALTLSDDDFDGTNTVKTKRSMIYSDVGIDSDESASRESLVRAGLKDRINTLNTNLNNVNKMFGSKATIAEEDTVLSRSKRQLDYEDEIDSIKRKTKKFIKNKLRNSDESKPRLEFLRKLFGITPRSEVTRVARHDKIRKIAKNMKNKTNKRKQTKQESIENNSLDDTIDTDNAKLRRKRRNVIEEKQKTVHVKESEDASIENEIDHDTAKEVKLWKILHRIHKQIKDLSIEDNEDDNSQNLSNNESNDGDPIVENVRNSDDDTTDIFKRKTKRGLLKSTVDNVVSVLSDLNKNLNRFWNALTLLE
ncbi:heparanase isoform X2 [Pectinophora gossypiella]|nr:heparanase isoform X2 [Pectinophora gossypiella]XP_049880572.1 heparanase isoform X2 [Pectinophora gossypiella]